MARKRSPARLVIALSVAGVLAVFLLYTSIAGGGTPSLAPSAVGQRADTVTVAGKVVGSVTGDAHAGGLRFSVQDIKGGSKLRLKVLYTGSVPDLFRSGRDISVQGRLRNGTFVAVPGTLVTKCPSKYTPKKG